MACVSMCEIMLSGIYQMAMTTIVVMNLQEIVLMLIAEMENNTRI